MTPVYILQESPVLFFFEIRIVGVFVLLSLITLEQKGREFA